MGFIASSFNKLFLANGIELEYKDLSALITKTKYEKETGHKIQVEIKNGCGIPNLARMYTDFLRDEGFDVVDSKNADNFNYLNTKILLHRGELNRAHELASILNVDQNYITEDKNDNFFYDLTLIIGKDYINLPSYKDAVLFQPPF